MPNANCVPARSRPIPAAAFALFLAACASPPPPESPPPAPAAAAPAPAPAAPQANASIVGQARSFSTQLATYTATGFDSLPGWGRDDLTESWSAFLGSCQVLGARNSVWQQVCAQARSVNRHSSVAIRDFFESAFTPYQIRDDSRRSDGVVTGYFEAEITGSRHYAPPNIYPVYGAPRDMLYLDTRKLPKGGSGTVVARIEQRNVIVQTGLSTRDLGKSGLYTLELARIRRDALDRKARLRVEGRSLVPYFTREEIESRAAPDASVLAFVSDPLALYEMQIQGSGRIRFADGQVLRVGYAEQNGQPFRPALARNAKGQVVSAVRTRGGAIELDDDDDNGSGAVDVSAVRVRGFTLARPTHFGAVQAPGQRIAKTSGSGITDPSYVFFKTTEQNSAGPIGALGLPLTAGRSIAVDPRSTPLGYPVYVASTEPGSRAPMQRLTVAQDTGGAIRGAIRADYFFGQGARAARQARGMKAPGQLWLLLPRGMEVAASQNAGVGAGGAVRTRGANADALPQCLVPDENSCVE